MAELEKAEGHPTCTTFAEDGWELRIDRQSMTGEIFHLAEDPDRSANLWAAPNHLDQKIRLLLRCITCRMANEPIPMPRIASA